MILIKDEFIVLLRIYYDAIRFGENHWTQSNLITLCYVEALSLLYL